MFGKKRKLSNERFYLVPAVVIVAICTQIPFIFCIVYSFTNWNLTRPDKGITFAGLKNYIGHGLPCGVYVFGIPDRASAGS